MESYEVDFCSWSRVLVSSGGLRHWLRLNYLKARRFGGANLWFVEFGVLAGCFLAASYIVRIERVFLTAGNDTSEFLPRLSCCVGLAEG